MLLVHMFSGLTIWYETIYRHALPWGRLFPPFSACLSFREFFVGLRPQGLFPTHFDMVISVILFNILYKVESMPHTRET